MFGGLLKICLLKLISEQKELYFISYIDQTWDTTIAATQFVLLQSLVETKAGSLTFSKTKVLENSALFTNMASKSLVNIFGRDKDKLFNVLVRAFPLPLVSDLVEEKLWEWISYYDTEKKKIMKTQEEKKTFCSKSFLE